jgi:nucleotide-binding universal stress UspA family protein
MPPDMKTHLGFRSVVLGTDFSPSAHLAGRYAVRFARHFQASLIVAHAFTLVQPALEIEVLEHVWSKQRQDLNRLLDATLEDLAPWPDGTESVLAESSPTELLHALSHKYGPSLVVLGTHGHGMVTQHTVGSIAEAILRSLDSPILTVGPHVPAPPTADLTFRRILYATDFSLAAARAAPYAVALAREFGSDIDMLHVVSGDEKAEGLDGPSRDEEFLDALRQLLPEEAEWLCKSRTFVESGNVRDRILHHASEGIDLIVMGAHHHSWFARHLRTGPAFQIILAAACPVLTTTAVEDTHGTSS